MLARVSSSAGQASDEPVHRAAIIESLARLISSWGAGTLEELRALVAPGIESLPEERLRELIDRTRTSGSSWGFHPADPFVRGLSRQIMGRVLDHASELEGGGNLTGLAGRGVLLVGNHLSYVDANAFEYLCQREGHEDFVNRLVVVAGPKVYSQPIRLLASLCFGTIKTPQSARIASGEAVMSPREVARIALQTLGVARERLGQGDPVLLFPEGSRSRSGALQVCLPAVARYLEIPGTWIVPFAHVGCEKLVPLEEDHVYPGRIDVRIGAPIEAAQLLERTQRNRGCAVDVLGFWIAELLPAGYRGYYGEPLRPELEQARQIALELRAPRA